jgi:tRNA threonylcarbamoyladenosine biosynthesis protein TsaB
MKILAIETATIEVGVSVVDETGPLASVTARAGRAQVETLHPAIAETCRLAGVRPADLDAIAVDVGPGLFTGIRVGVAAAKALAGGLGLQVVTATSLQVLVAACKWAGRVVVPVVDMRRKEVAWLPPWASGDDVRVGDPTQFALELADWVAASGEGIAPVLVGDGALRYRDELEGAGLAGVLFGGTELAAPPVTSLGVLGVAAMGENKGCDPALVHPVYGREADTRINWTSRHDPPAAL